MSRSIIHFVAIVPCSRIPFFDFSVNCMCLLFDLRSLHNFSYAIKCVNTCQWVLHLRMKPSAVDQRNALIVDFNNGLICDFFHPQSRRKFGEFFSSKFVCLENFPNIQSNLYNWFFYFCVYQAKYTYTQIIVIVY